MKLISRIGWMLARPKSVFPLVKEEKLGKAWLYLMLVMMISSIPVMVTGWFVFNRFLAPIIQGIPLGVMRLITIILMPFTANLVLFLLLLGAVLLITLSLKILKTNIKFSDSLKVMFYAITPFALTFWLVPVAIITFIWSIMLVARGYKVMFDLSQKKVLGVILFFSILAGILGFLLRFLAR